VLCAGAMRTIVEAALPAFSAGEPRIEVGYTRSGLVRDRVSAGERFDVVITTRSALEPLLARGLIVPESAVALAHSGIGVAIRRGAARPQIDTVAAFTQMLRTARSIAYADPATGSPSGTYLVAMLDRLGMTAELAPKTRLAGAEGGHAVVVAELVARGDAEIAIQQISELLAVNSVELVGPLPEELQHLTTFSAGIGGHAGNPSAARQLLEFLSSSTVSPIIREQGMIPAA
jgi:molybdate transport system substrate-binding protein